MKIIALLFTLLFVSNKSFSQEPVLAKPEIKAFAYAAKNRYKYGNGVFQAFCNQALSREGYSMSKVIVAMESLDTDKASREILFKAIADVSGDFDSLFSAFYGLVNDAKIANLITSYVYLKYKKG